jgi:hypothetical protein
MLGLHFILSTALQCLFCLIATGFQIDESCVKEGIENDVRDAMISALEMADAAHNRITAHPLDQDTVDLVAKLFAEPNQDPRTAVTAKTVDTYARILQFYRAEVPRGTAVASTDVVSCPTALYKDRKFTVNDRSSSVTESASG